MTSVSPRMLAPAIAGAAFLAGIGLIGDAAMTRLKAWLAPVLIDRAWAATRETGAPARPWPWADHWPTARLSVPRLGVDLPVLSGADGSALAFAPGQVPGMAAPGTPGHAALAGHRDTHFRFLEHMRVGDEILIEDAAARRHRYRVSGTAVVDSRATRLDPSGPAARLTLVTCWPFDSLVPGGPMRWLVFADRLPD